MFDSQQQQLLLAGRGPFALWACEARTCHPNEMKLRPSQRESESSARPRVDNDIFGLETVANKRLNWIVAGQQQQEWEQEWEQEQEQQQPQEQEQLEQRCLNSNSIIQMQYSNCNCDCDCVTVTVRRRAPHVARADTRNLTFNQEASPGTGTGIDKDSNLAQVFAVVHRAQREFCLSTWLGLLLSS